MKRSKHTSKRRKKELQRLGIGVSQGHRMDDNGLQFCRANEWDSKLPSRDGRSVRRRGKDQLRKDNDV